MTRYDDCIRATSKSKDFKHQCRGVLTDLEFSYANNSVFNFYSYLSSYN